MSRLQGNRTRVSPLDAARCESVPGLWCFWHFFYTHTGLRLALMHHKGAFPSHWPVAWDQKREYVRIVNDYWFLIYIIFFTELIIMIKYCEKWVGKYETFFIRNKVLNFWVPHSSQKSETEITIFERFFFLLRERKKVSNCYLLNFDYFRNLLSTQREKN